MGYSRTVNEALYSPDCPVLWMKEIRNWGRSGMISYCSIVCCESSSWLWLKNWGMRRTTADVSVHSLAAHNISP